ncbi:hypothetical protein AB0F43_31735 [Kribbella sp. NPDC023972]|uniref:hypothetical protein n=1 Tax=Kribbella sp. NPDC023972 TaxID=3154795 RepID=UPI0033FA4C46
MAKEVRGVRWFTAARHVPLLIGRTHDGTRIKGGPYTLVQAFVVPITAGVMWGTRGLWDTGSWVLNIGFTLLTAVGIGWVSGRLPDDRNPLLWVAGLFIATTQPRWGKSNGRRVTVPKPVRIRSHVVVQCRELSTIQTEPTPAAEEQQLPAVDVEPAVQQPMVWPAVAVRHTGVEALLASIKQGEQR